MPAEFKGVAHFDSSFENYGQSALYHPPALENENFQDQIESNENQTNPLPPLSFLSKRSINNNGSLSARPAGEGKRCLTPLPAPVRALTARTHARKLFVKSAAFPYDDIPPTLNYFIELEDHHNYQNPFFYSNNANNNTQYNYNSLDNNYTGKVLKPLPPNRASTASTYKQRNMFASLLPSPRIIVHNPVRHALYKSAMEKKHRGTSRNVLGGFYTS